MGNPYNITKDSAPEFKALEQNTIVTYGDLDASPTKAWLIERRNDEKWKWHYDYAFGKRPREELYVLVDDPDQINNVADDEKYGPVQTLIARLEWGDLDGILETLSEHMPTREYFVLCEWTGLGYGPDGNEARSQSCIARELGVTPQAVNQSLRFALRKTEKVLTDSGFFDKHLAIED